MAKQLGLDFAGGIPRAAAIKAAGYDFVCRYLTPGGRGLPGKLLKANEYAALQAAGVAVVVNWETAADRMRDGFAAGVEDARSAQSVLDALGVPTTVPVYFSADWDASEAEQQVIDNYLHGARSVLGAQRIGVYGSFYVVRRCLNNATAVWAWQAGAWSGGQIEPRAHIYQRIGFATVDGVECDVNEARQINFGQHPSSSLTHLGRERPMLHLEPTTTSTGTPDATWTPREETITMVGPVGGWAGRQLVHFTPGNGGAWVQEAWFGPSGTHVVSPDKPTLVKQFDTQGWEAPSGSRVFVIRFASRSLGSLTLETEH